mgnify:CR=1
MEDNKEMNEKKPEQFTDEQLKDVSGGDSIVWFGRHFCPDRKKRQCQNCKHRGNSNECVKQRLRNGVRGFDPK